MTATPTCTPTFADFGPVPNGVSQLMWDNQPWAHYFVPGGRIIRPGMRSFAARKGIIRGNDAYVNPGAMGRKSLKQRGRQVYEYEGRKEGSVNVADTLFTSSMSGAILDQSDSPDINAEACAYLVPMGAKTSLGGVVTVGAYISNTGTVYGVTAEDNKPGPGFEILPFDMPLEPISSSPTSSTANGYTFSNFSSNSPYTLTNISTATDYWDAVTLGVTASNVANVNNQYIRVTASGALNLGGGNYCYMDVSYSWRLAGQKLAVADTGFSLNAQLSFALPPWCCQIVFLYTGTSIAGNIGRSSALTAVNAVPKRFDMGSIWSRGGMDGGLSDLQRGLIIDSHSIDNSQRSAAMTELPGFASKTRPESI